MLQPEEMIDINEWFECEISRKEMKSYLKRNNYRGLLHVGLWLVLLAAAGILAYHSLGTGWTVLFFLIYGVIYSSANAIWHETSHGTVFTTNWFNSFFYFLCGAMELRDMVDFRWSHSRHHSFTLHHGVDPEIPSARPPKLMIFFMDFFYIYNGTLALKNIILHSLGIVSSKAKNYVPPEEYKSMFRAARAVLLIQLIPIILAIYFKSILPMLYFGLPRFYGAFIQFTFIALQHAGMPENEWDHRKSCRSLSVSPLFSFLFMNMENHIEHHMYPMVPFHALPKLSKQIKKEMPERYKAVYGKGFWEMIKILFRQKKNPQLSVVRNIPGNKGE